MDFLLTDVTNAPGLASSHITVPVEIGIDLVGYTYTDCALRRCKVLAPSTYADENNTVWNTLEFTSSTYPDQFSKVSEIRA
jgi:hypothetical protein